MAVNLSKGAKKPESSVQLSGAVVRKADTQIVIDQPLDIEDEFQSLYETSGSSNVVVEPPFNPLQLVALCNRNNTLQQCIHAMEVNIDGTGHTVEPIDEGRKEPKPKENPFGEKKPPFEGKEGKPLFGDKKPGEERFPSASEDREGVEKAFGDPEQGGEEGAEKRPSPFGEKKPPFVGQKPPFDPLKAKQAVADHMADALENDPEKIKAESFFNEPYPGMSMITLRRLVRVDLESTGNAYIEAVRNVKGELLMLRHLPAYSMRLIRLDVKATPVTRKIVRDGKEIEVELPVRERRFVQKVSNKRVYYREFGSHRQVNKDTGEWVEPTKKLPPEKMASEVIWFKGDRDANTPYGIPRWINNLPSVLGSRKAEEFNLEFFDAGGMPPAIIIVEGGAMTTPVKEQLLHHLTGKGRVKHRAAVVEVQSASGSIDRPGKVNVKVERFGDARQGDSLFQNYDKQSAEHVRSAFRLPPLFLGESQSYNFATAAISYMVAEAQVFAPERKEFDDVMNNTVMKELQIKKFKFVSKPVTLKNVDLMLKGLQMGQQLIEGEEMVTQINQITGLNLTYSPEMEQKLQEMKMFEIQEKAKAGGGFPPGKPGQKPPFGKPGQGPGQGEEEDRPSSGVGAPSKGFAALKAELTPNDIVVLVHKWTVASGIEDGDLEPGEKTMVLKLVDALDGTQRDLFDKILATKSFMRSGLDLNGLSEISRACTKLFSH